MRGALLALLLGLPMTAAAAEPPASSDPLATIETNAQFAVVMDYETGAVLFSKRGD